MNNYYFPFGEKLTKVQQSETTPNKEVFVLGVYASAVHAKWLDKDGKIKVQALAVASEPEIFWRGLDAKEQIEKFNDFKKNFFSNKDLINTQVEQLKREMEDLKIVQQKEKEINIAFTYILLLFCCSRLLCINKVCSYRRKSKSRTSCMGC